MPTLGDSSAVCLPTRILPQHQAVLTLVKERIEDPASTVFRWLDIACGRGQILACVDGVLSETCRQKIQYFGIDVVNEHCLRAQEFAQGLFPAVRVEVCEIDKFELHLNNPDRFDAITLTNAVHEITPEQLSATFISALSRVSDNGFLFVYDMESLPSLELGAIPWRGFEVEQIFHEILRAAGETSYLPKASTWPHRSCIGWNIHLVRRYLSIPNDAFQLQRQNLEIIAAAAIRKVLREKLLLIHRQLAAAARFPTITDNDKEERVRLAFDFWAIARALELPLAIPL